MAFREYKVADPNGRVLFRVIAKTDPASKDAEPFPFTNKGHIVVIFPDDVSPSVKAQRNDLKHKTVIGPEGTNRLAFDIQYVVRLQATIEEARGWLAEQGIL